MFADFLPATVGKIRDPEAIALLQQMQRQAVLVEFSASAAIATAYVHSSPLPFSQENTTPILLLHGFDSSLLEFRRLIPLLVNSQEIWAIDHWGAGFTQYVPTLAIDPQTIRQHLLAVIKTWIQRPVILVGASLGGAVAIDFALHQPQWVQSLVLINSVGFSGSFSVGQFLPQPLIDLGADWLYWRKHAVLAAATLPIFASPLSDLLRCSALHQEMPGWKAAIAAFTQSGGYANLGDRIRNITQPTLILWGDADDVLGTADATQFEQAIASSQLVWIPRAGHAPHLEQPRAIANHLLNFLSLNQ